MDESVLVPTDRFRSIVERWLAGFEKPEEGFQALASSSPYTADAWRKRLVGTSPTWFVPIRLDAADVDEFLTAADLTHLWQTELDDLLPEYHPTDEQFDETCAQCGRWIDWRRTDTGVRVELKRPRKWTQWSSLCSLCYARWKGCAPSPDCTGKVRARIPEAVLLQLYERYIREEIGLDRLAAGVFEQFGCPTARSCSVAITHAWRRAGFPLRDRNLSKRLNGKHRHRKLGTRIPEADLRRMHLLHEKRYVSIWRIANQNYGRYGYKSAKSMTAGISHGWKALGLKAHDRIEMTVRASTINGLSPRKWEDRKRLRKAAGLTSHGRQRQPLCVEPGCKTKALMGREWCHFHAPERREAAMARMDEFRRSSPFFTDVVPLGELHAALVDWYEWNGRRWRPLVEATGWSSTKLSRLMLHCAPESKVMPVTVEGLRRGLELVTSPALREAA